jgi:hypothetical protein
LLASFHVPTFVLLALFQVPTPADLVFGHICVTAFLAALLGWPLRWLWRLCRRVRGFATAENSRIVLHYEPELSRREIISAVLQSCEEELDSLTRLFGSPLRSRVTVYLFSHWRDISVIRGPGIGGLAIPLANAVVIANDNRVPELMRHELAHLFAFRWSLHPPPLLREGIAVWLQGTVFGQPIDTAVLSLLRAGGPRLSSLLQSKFFFSEANRHMCYVLAGSFTGFLIRRYGWDRYRKLYRNCAGTRFRAKFQKYIGVSLEEAEWHWRNERIVMPILNRRSGRKPHS